MIPDFLPFLTRLIQTPSQAGIDASDSVLAVLESWFTQRQLKGQILKNTAGNDCGYFCITGEEGPLYLLNACADTAAVGNTEIWTYSPFGAEIHDGWLYGRGAGDSKAGVCLFSHLFHHFSERKLNGRLAVLFDTDEHTGEFGGIKAAVSAYPDIKGVFIGYPGQSELVTGARGFFRIHLYLYGTAEHTGAEQAAGNNAAVRGAGLVCRLYENWENLLNSSEKNRKDKDFPFGPKMTLTALDSGGPFSVVPDTCHMALDFRLTHTFTAEDVRLFLQASLPKDMDIKEQESWPAYTLNPDHSLVQALSSGVERALGMKLPEIYCGPSNIGNYLASKGIPATCGFGAVCENYHAADERIRKDSLAPVYEAYRKSLEILLNPES